MIENISQLKRIAFSPNWRNRGPVPKDTLIRGLGNRLEEVATSVANALAPGGTIVGLAAEKLSQPSAELTIRLIERINDLHKCKVDVAMVRKGDDLFLRFNSEARTWITYVTWAATTSMLVAVFSVLAFGYLSGTGAFAGIVEDIARQHSGGNGSEIGEAKILGLIMDPVTQKIKRGAPITFWSFAISSPRTAILHLSTPFVCIAGAAGLCAYALKKRAVDLACRLANCPNPKSFEDFVAASGTWVQGTVYKSLFDNFGVSESERIACS